MLLPRRIALACLASSLASAWSPSTWATGRRVALTGILGRKALLAIDGGALHSLAEGESYQGIRLLRLSATEASVEIDGQTRTLRLGEAPVSVGASGERSSNARIVLTADSRGHFTQTVRINEQLVEAVVDTGASTIAIGKRDADRMGIDYSKSTPQAVNTANGVARAWPVRLNSLRMGDAQLWNVEAVVLPQDMPFVLLGNNFLAEFSMTRNNDQMVLTQRR